MLDIFRGRFKREPIGNRDEIVEHKLLICLLTSLFRRVINIL